MEFRHTRANDQ